MFQSRRPDWKLAKSGLWLFIQRGGERERDWTLWTDEQRKALRDKRTAASRANPELALKMVERVEFIRWAISNELFGLQRLGKVCWAVSRRIWKISRIFLESKLSRPEHALCVHTIDQFEAAPYTTFPVCCYFSPPLKSWIEFKIFSDTESTDGRDSDEKVSFWFSSLSNTIHTTNLDFKSVF